MAEEVEIIFKGKDDVSNTLKKIENESDTAANKVKKQWGLKDFFKDQFKMAGTMIAGAFAVSAVINFGKQIVEVTSKYEKFKTMLNNTYQSKSLGESVFNTIREFAKKTPYQLEEVMDAWIKLKNRGIEPNMDLMTKLGDIASAMGKPLDQLVEAALDAMTGENERLKEFGIKGEKSGNKIKYTFRGITTEVENTESAIINYIYSLGELEGIQDGMIAQSETLGGRISNLKDSFEGLQYQLGQLLLPSMEDFTFKSTRMLEGINSLIEGGNSLGDVFRNLGKIFGGLIQASFGKAEAAFIMIKQQAEDEADYFKDGKRITGLVNIIPKDEIVKDYMDYFSVFDEKQKIIERDKLLKEVENMLQRGDVNAAQARRRRAEINLGFSGPAPVKFDPKNTGGGKSGSGTSGSGTGKDDPSLRLNENRTLKNVYIQIDKQVETLNIYPETVAESKEEIVDTIMEIFKEVGYNIT